MLLLEKDTTKKGQVYKNITRYIKTLLLYYIQEHYKNVRQLEFEASNNKESEIDGILKVDQHFFLMVESQYYNF